MITSTYLKLIFEDMMYNVIRFVLGIEFINLALLKILRIFLNKMHS
uniref:Uncharacterized protein n=1 Tax=Bartonella rochalimae ATCC BAA-1498 TaxID=685782 RepID=E6YKH5_9HYPH|nr:hypothetical protein BARRO_20020 [Bartonella rochalimae ATCC BAA-1498]